MKRFKFHLFYFFLLLACCKLTGKHYLKRTVLGIYESVDTIEYDSVKGIYLVNIVSNGLQGEFRLNLALMKNVKGKQIFYSFAQRNNWRSVITSKNIAFVEKANLDNSGWFFLKNGKIIPRLPNIKNILDSIKRKYGEKYFVSEHRGYIRLFLNDTLKINLNYGYFVCKNKFADFEQSQPKLYKLSGQNIVILSNNPNDLFYQNDGLFYIPKPGYGVVESFDKEEVLRSVDSIINNKVLPDKIEIM